MFQAFVLPVTVPVTVSVTEDSDGVATKLKAVVPDMEEPPDRVLDVPVAQARSLFWVQLGSADPTMGLLGKFWNQISDETHPFHQ